MPPPPTHPAMAGRDPGGGAPAGGDDRPAEHGAADGGARPGPATPAGCTPRDARARPAAVAVQGVKRRGRARGALPMAAPGQGTQRPPTRSVGVVKLRSAAPVPMQLLLHGWAVPQMAALGRARGSVASGSSSV